MMEFKAPIHVKKPSFFDKVLYESEKEGDLMEKIHKIHLASYFGDAEFKGFFCDGSFFISDSEIAPYLFKISIAALLRELEDSMKAGIINNKQVLRKKLNAIHKSTT